MTEFGTLEIVTDLEVKGQKAEPNRQTLDPAQSHTPTPPPEGQSQTGTATAPANQSQPGLSQCKGMTAHVFNPYNFVIVKNCSVYFLCSPCQFQPFFLCFVL